MSNLWLLEAKVWPEDTRGEAARTAKFYLRPGAYTVGRQSKQCDIDVADDKTISRLHAQITVPAEDWASSRTAPHVTVHDSSRYGTLVTEANDMTPTGAVGAKVKARHRWLIRFGYQSPFRLHHLEWAAVLHPSCTPEIAVKADAVGFERRTTFTEAPATTFLIVPGPEVALDGTVLAALLAGSPVVSARYLEAWEARKVWKNEYPRAEDHAARVRVDGAALSQAEARERMGEPGPDPLLMKGIKLLWHATSDDDIELENLKGVTTELCGAGAGEWPKTASAAKRLAKGAVVVLNNADADVAARAFLAECRWTTREDVVKAVAAGSIEGLVQLPQATQAEEEDEEAGLADEADEPARRRKRAAEAAAEGAARPATRRRASQQTAVADEDAETDDEEELRVGKGISISVAATEAQDFPSPGAPPSVTKAAASKRTRTASVAPSPSKIASGATKDSLSMAGKRRRGARGGAATLESNAVAEVPSPPSVRPSPANKPRVAGSPSTFIPETVIGPTSDSIGASVRETAGAGGRRATARPLPTPVGEGWHAVVRTKRPKSRPAPAEQQQQTLRQQETTLTSGGAATTVEEGAVVTAVAPSAVEGGPEVEINDDKEPKPAVDASAVLIDENLVVVAPVAAGAAPPGPRGFKAFRRKGDAVAGFGSEEGRILIPFDPEPYREGGVNDDEFLREEEERKQAARAADALFDANLKVKRDKKALDAGRTRLLALADSGRRRGGGARKD